MTKALITILILTILSCNNSDNSNASSSSDTKQVEKTDTFPVKELFVENGDEEGWGADIRLSIISNSETDTSKVFTAISTYEGKRLGLLVSIPKKKEGDKGFASGITLKSIGAESDNLLKVLSKLYKQKVDTTLKFTSSVSVTYVNLDEFAKSLGAEDGGQYKTENQYKLFYEGEKEGDYAEIYLNINPTEHWIELKEKDEEYRPVIIKFLRQ
ncbi:hypothetical protein ESA94_03420 [Lacibacter luteus]|uniref:Uncharacterized protein n=1 Tax=Lacibacter luteus TaxID=2508719 RepID=A0A4Q1CMQ3_9BACT|nr:hypothetical protein [Lacibacter luteus]RXK62074.1 hypothetical protein ESA94_03420 [Lacibacter luteus]